MLLSSDRGKSTYDAILNPMDILHHQLVFRSFYYSITTFF